MLDAALSAPNTAANFSILRVMRVVRVVRVARVIRIMRVFRELRIMIYSILSSGLSLLWVALVFLLMFYIFGISFTMAAVAYLETSDMWLAEENANLLLYFGTLDRSMLSLYMSMSGGNDWGQYYEALLMLPFHYRIIFLTFITIAVFAVVNIVTGVFVESAMQSSLSDRDVIVHEEMRAKAEFLAEMRHIFEEMDSDQTGRISKDEFEETLREDRVVAYFSAMKLDVSDAHQLFVLLDYNRSGEIDINEFLDGCYKLQGQSRTLDVAIMKYELQYLRELSVGYFSTAQDESPADVQSVLSPFAPPLQVLSPETDLPGMAAQ